MVDARSKWTPAKISRERASGCDNWWTTSGPGARAFVRLRLRFDPSRTWRFGRDAVPPAAAIVPRMRDAWARILTLRLCAYFHVLCRLLPIALTSRLVPPAGITGMNRGLNPSALEAVERLVERLETLGGRLVSDAEVRR